MKFRYLATFFLFSIFSINSLTAKTVNGIDIPENIENKLIEYREKFSIDCANDFGSYENYSVQELDKMLKKAVKYDATYFCPICRVYFPILSESIKTNCSKDVKICLDGYPEKMDFQLPPECPYCTSICPSGEYDYENSIDVIRAARRSYYTFAKPNILTRYIKNIEILRGNTLSDYEKFQIYFKYARSGKTDRSEYLRVAVGYLNSFIKDFDEVYSNDKLTKNTPEKDDSTSKIIPEKNDNTSKITPEKDDNASKINPPVNKGERLVIEFSEAKSKLGLSFEIYMLRIDLFRQIGNFKKALKYLDELEKKFSNISDYKKELLRIERSLIQDKQTNLVELPLGNKLHIAIRNNTKIENLNINKDELDKLITQENRFYQTPICQAIYDGNLDYLKYILKIKPELLKEKDLRKRTPLEYAAKFGNVPAIKYLLESGCDVNNGGDCSPIFLAVNYGRIDAVNYLIEKGANLRDSNGKSVIEKACWGNNKDKDVILKKLVDIEKEKNPNFKDEINKYYLIVFLHGSIEKYQILREIGIEEDFSKNNRFVGIKKEFIPILAKLKNAEDLLYDDYRYTMMDDSKNKNNDEKLSVYNTLDIYEKLQERYEKEEESEEKTDKEFEDDGDSGDEDSDDDNDNDDDDEDDDDDNDNDDDDDDDEEDDDEEDDDDNNNEESNEDEDDDDGEESDISVEFDDDEEESSDEKEAKDVKEAKDSGNDKIEKSNVSNK